MRDFDAVPDLHKEVGVTVYVDNGVLARCRVGAAGQARQCAQKVLVKAGLPVHDIQDETGSIETLGFDLRSKEASVKPAPC